MAGQWDRYTGSSGLPSLLSALTQCGEISHSWRHALLTTLLFSLFSPRRLQIIRKIMPLPTSSWVLMLFRHSCRYQCNGAILGQCMDRYSVLRRNRTILYEIHMSAEAIPPLRLSWHSLSLLMFNLKHLYSVFVLSCFSCCLPLCEIWLPVRASYEK